MKKRHLRILTALVLALGMLMSCCSALAARSEETWSWSVTRQPTCTQGGERVGRSSYGNSKVESTPALGHNYGPYTPVVEATESSPGTMRATCRRCGNVHTYTYYLPGTYYPGDNRPEDAPTIAALEEILGDIGYDVGRPDGKYDSATSDAVSHIQQIAGTESTGVVYPSTMEILLQCWQETQGISRTRHTDCYPNGDGTHTWFTDERPGLTEDCRFGNGEAYGSGTVYTCQDCGQIRVDFTYRNRPVSMYIPESTGAMPLPIRKPLSLSAISGEEKDENGLPLEVTLTISNNTEYELTQAGCSRNMSGNLPQTLAPGESFTWTQPAYGGTAAASTSGGSGADPDGAGQEDAGQQEIVYEAAYINEYAQTYHASVAVKGLDTEPYIDLELFAGYKPAKTYLPAGTVVDLHITPSNNGDYGVVITNVHSDAPATDHTAELQKLVGKTIKAGSCNYANMVSLSIVITEDDIKKGYVDRSYSADYTLTKDAAKELKIQDYQGQSSAGHVHFNLYKPGERDPKLPEVHLSTVVWLSDDMKALKMGTLIPVTLIVQAKITSGDTKIRLGDLQDKGGPHDDKDGYGLNGTLMVMNEPAVARIQLLVTSQDESEQHLYRELSIPYAGIEPGFTDLSGTTNTVCINLNPIDGSIVDTKQQANTSQSEPEPEPEPQPEPEYQPAPAPVLSPESVDTPEIPGFIQGSEYNPTPEYEPAPAPGSDSATTPEGDPGPLPHVQPEELAVPNVSLTVSYPSDPVHAGDSIPAALTVDNNGDVPVTILNLSGQAPADNVNGWVSGYALGAMDSHTFLISVTAGKTDLINEKVIRSFSASFAGTGEGVDPSTRSTNFALMEVDVLKEEETTDPDPEERVSITLIKKETSSPGNKKFYTAGETIKYEITVSNTGKVPLTNIDITDSIGGVHLGSISQLDPDQSQTFPFEYTVQESDLIYPFISNYATCLYAVTYANIRESLNSNTVYSPIGVDIPSQVVPAPVAEADCCRLTFTGAGDNNRTYHLHLCEEHAPVWEAMEAQFTGISDDLSALRAWQRAEALWRSALEGANQKALAAASATNRPAILAEQQAWSQYLESQKSLLNRLFPEQPLTVLRKTVQLLVLRCAEQCGTAHGDKAQAWRMPAGGLNLLPAYENAVCEQSLARESEGEIQVGETLCETHAKLDAMLLSQLQAAEAGSDQSALWEQSILLWQSSMSSVLSRRFSQGSAATQAEIITYQEALEQLAEARRIALALRWPSQPDAVAEALAVTMRTAVLTLCEP